MRVRNCYVEKRRQMRYTRKRIPAALRNNLKAIIKWDSGDYYGNTGLVIPSRPLNVTMKVE